MYIIVCTLITKLISNHGGFKPQISINIIILEALKNSGLGVPGTHKGLLFICERIHTGH